MPQRTPVSIDMTAFTTPYYQGLTYNQNKKIQDETLAENQRQNQFDREKSREDMDLKKKDFMLKAESQIYDDEYKKALAKEAQQRAELMVPEFDYKVKKANQDYSADMKKADVEQSKVAVDKENNRIKLMDDYFKALEKTDDPATQKFINKTYSKLFKENGDIVAEGEDGLLKWKRPAEAEKQITKESAQYIGKLKESTDILNNSRGTIANAQIILDDPNFDANPGAFAGFKRTVAGYAKELGMDSSAIDSANDTATLDAQLNNLVLEAGKKMKGSFSDKDIAFLKSSTATATDTKDAIRMKLKFLDDAYAKEMDKSKFISNIYETDPQAVLTKGDSLYDQAYNFPRKVLTKDERTGKKVMKTFSEFEAIMRRKDPNLTRADIIDSWNDAYNISTGENVRDVDFSTRTLSAPVRKYLGAYEE
jgi:hypothetical protein